MKIGINALFLIPGEVGGSETYFRNTLISAVRLYPQHEFVVFTNRENKQILVRDLSKYSNAVLVDMRASAKSRARRILREQFILPKVIRANKIDVLWCPGNSSVFSCPCPCVTTIHDMQYMSFPEDFSKIALLAMRVMTSLSIKKSDAILTVSEFSRQEIIKYANADCEKITVTLEAANSSFSQPLPNDFIAERVMVLTHSTEPYILMVSNSYPHKNLNVGVEAFGQICAEIPHNLVIVGKPRLGEPALQKAISALPDSSRVIRLTYLTNQDLIALYQGAQIFLFPSLYEGFGLPVLEAMSAGVPVLASRFGSIPEVGGTTIQYANPPDAPTFATSLKKLIAMPKEERDSSIANQKKRAEKFSWDNTATLTVSTCEEMVNQAPLLKRGNSLS